MKPGFYSKKIELRFCDCDYKKRMRLSAMLANMSDIAGLAYRDKGFSHTWLWENGFVFLVSRASARIKQMPVADEELTVTTWERETKGVLFYRDFSFTNVKGEVVAEASTAWLLANPHTRSILRPRDFTGKIDPNPEVVADVLPPSKLKLPAEFTAAGERKIVFSDIDANGHVYNAVYAAIACDFLPAFFMEKEIGDCLINFKQEAKLGETMAIKTAIDGQTAVVVGEVGGVVSFEAQIIAK